MAQVKSSPQLTDITNDKDKWRYAQLCLQGIIGVVNGRLDVGNLNGKVKTVSFVSANTDTTADHGLGRVPSYYVILGQSAAMSIYDGSVASTASAITLKSSAVGSARILFL